MVLLGKIIKDPSVFESSYFPYPPISREREFALLNANYWPGLSRVLVGLPGTGKTLLLKLLNPPAGLEPIHIDCKYLNTSSGLLFELSSRLGIKVPHNGWTLDQMLDLILNSCREPRYILMLDGIDQLLVKDHGLFYDLAKLWLSELECSLLASCTEPRILERIDSRLRKLICRYLLVLPPYAPDQLIRILEQRAALGFRPGSCSPDALMQCSYYAAKYHSGNARVALELLFSAAKEAEQMGASKIQDYHVLEAISRHQLEIHRWALWNLGIHAKLALLGLSSRSKPLTTGELYREYKQLCSQLGRSPCTRRHFSRNLRYLESSGLLRRKLVNRGRRGGRTCLLQFTLPSNQLRELLANDPELDGARDLIGARQSILWDFS